MRPADGFEPLSEPAGRSRVCRPDGTRRYRTATVVSIASVEGTAPPRQVWTMRSR